jgi:hypothetical protein
MAEQRYATPKAFRQALEARLQDRARREALVLQRIRRQLSFDRLLAPLFASPAEAPWVLKGSYALELHFRHARSTKDVDLTLRSGAIRVEAPQTQREVLRKHLQQATSIRLPDFFEFLVHPATLDLEGAPEGGVRFPVQAVMDGRIFTKFHVDVGIGDEVTEPLELVHGGDWLSFAGISPPQFLSLSREQQWAEKFHAYTRPRHERTNSRAKDLIDLVLLTESGDLAQERVLECVRGTFERRQTHPLPAEMLPPPIEWARTFAALAEEVGVEADIDTGYRYVSDWWLRIKERES